MGGTPVFAPNIIGFPKERLALDVLVQILRGGAEIKLSRVPVIDEAWDFVAQGIVPGGTERNRQFLLDFLSGTGGSRSTNN